MEKVNLILYVIRCRKLIASILSKRIVILKVMEVNSLLDTIILMNLFLALFENKIENISIFRKIRTT